MPTIKIGTVLLRRYRVDAVLGHGPSGMVYNAWDLGSEEPRPCAVKVLHQDLSALTAALVRLRHDNQSIARLHHPHLRGGQAELVFADDGTAMLVRALYHGETLRERLRRGPLSLPEACRLFLVLCGALEAAHGQGVVHGDLKPENLLFGRPAHDAVLDREARQRRGYDGEVLQVLDFGMLHLRGGGVGIGVHPLLGTVSYLSPEQIVGDGSSCDGRTDVFGLGALLYECLTGQVAFSGPQASAVMAQICDGAPPRLRGARPDLPRAAEVLIEMACHRLPEERLPSPGAVWLALKSAVGKEPGVAEALAREVAASAASSTRNLVREAAASQKSPAQAPRPSRPRRQISGSYAIQLFKELEQSSAAPAEAATEAAQRLTEVMDEVRAQRASQPLPQVSLNGDEDGEAERVPSNLTPWSALGLHDLPLTPPPPEVEVPEPEVDLSEMDPVVPPKPAPPAGEAAGPSSRIIYWLPALVLALLVAAWWLLR